jgi:indolepyruvate ferredoxin oxidoreductase alpha subunit
MNRVLPYVWYPAFFAVAIAMFATMLTQGSHLLMALYIPIALVAIAIVGLELAFPARLDWKPRRSDVASDALSNLASGGVIGGALIVIGEDYGEGSSIMQERSHAFAMKSQIWLLDPKPDLESIVRAVETGFELSEASNTPVMLEVRIRACHVRGSFRTKANKRPPLTLRQALESPRRDTSRIVLPPASFHHEKEKIETRWPAAVKFIRERRLNEFVPGDVGEIGIILQGGMYNGVLRALQGLGLADVWGTSRISLYVLNVTYPLIPDEVVEFCQGKRAVLLVEEGQPDYIEQALSKIHSRAAEQPKPSRSTGSGRPTGPARRISVSRPACAIASRTRE